MTPSPAKKATSESEEKKREKEEEEEDDQGVETVAGNSSGRISSFVQDDDDDKPSIVQNLFSMVTCGVPPEEKMRNTLSLASLYEPQDDTEEEEDEDDHCANGYLGNRWAVCKQPSSSNVNNTSNDAISENMTPSATVDSPEQTAAAPNLPSSALFATAEDAGHSSTLKGDALTTLKEVENEDDSTTVDTTNALEVGVPATTASSRSMKDGMFVCEETECNEQKHVEPTYSPADPPESFKIGGDTSIMGTGAVMETFEMILEEHPVPPRNKNKFWRLRSKRASKMPAKLNVVALELTAEAEEIQEDPIIVEPAVEPSQDEQMEDKPVEVNGDDDEDDEDGRPAPPLLPVSEEIIVQDEEQEDSFAKEPAAVPLLVPETVSQPESSRTVVLLSSRKKEMRFKKLLGSLLSHRSVPVKEFDVAEPEALIVRVPGLEHPDKFLSSKDLIGDECATQDKFSVSAIMEDADEDEEDEELSGDRMDGEDNENYSASDDSNTNFISSNGETSFSAVPTTMASSRVRAEMSKLSEPVAVNKQRKTWVDRLNGCNNQNAMDDVVSVAAQDNTKPTALGRQTSPPETLGVTASLAPVVEMKKPAYKPAICPTSGRTYWYNRFTRETTWIKPADDDIIQSKPPKSIPFVLDMEEKKEETVVERNEAIDASTRAETSIPQELIRESSASEFDDKVGAAKEDIAKILKTMSFPEEQSVNGVLAQHDGQDEQLLLNLQDLVDAKPFDEPMEKSASSKTKVHSIPSPIASSSLPPRVQVKAKYAAVPMTRAQTHTTLNSSQSYVTESTVQIKNTFRPRIMRKDFETGSISSARQSHQKKSRNSKVLEDEMSANPVAVDKIPIKVPVPRSRELFVEEFNASGGVSEIYRGSGLISTRKPLLTRIRSNRLTAKVNSIPEDSASFGSGNYGDAEDGDTKDADSHSLPNDSISALSEADYLLDRKGGRHEESRRALDEAIAREDWDLAATLSEGMRTMTAKFTKEIAKSEWIPTVHDHFISTDEWETVVNYIAHIGGGEKLETAKEGNQVVTQLQPDGRPARKFDDGHSFESWDSKSFSSYDSDGSLSVSSSDSEHPSPHHRRVKSAPIASAAP